MLRFPEPIPTLRPKFVTIGRDGLVRLELGFGMWPLGVQVYPEDYPSILRRSSMVTANS